MARGKYQEWLNDEGLLKLQGWARDGLTDEQIAYNIGIRRPTLYAWEKKYSDISDALKKGKEVVDRKVENSLFKRATGYKTTEHQYKVVTLDDDVLWARRRKVQNEFKLNHPEATDDEIKAYAIENVPTRERIELFQTEKTVPPDTTAAIFWLKNRKPDVWRDRKETRLSGSLETNSRPLEKIDDKKLSELERKLTGDEGT
ncbi:helix-turn-helix domain-containing protein [Lentilactobacillus parabuchneri]|uniref:helix-turn-helix domain-containing protein n=1 Tax=Lentilactobacillus parabuchneri TaxID=152331 RepID=UPI0031DC1EC8